MTDNQDIDTLLQTIDNNLRELASWAESMGTDLLSAASQTLSAGVYDMEELMSSASARWAEFGTYLAGILEAHRVIAKAVRDILGMVSAMSNREIAARALLGMAEQQGQAEGE